TGCDAAGSWRWEPARVLRDVPHRTAEGHEAGPLVEAPETRAGQRQGYNRVQPPDAGDGRRRDQDSGGEDHAADACFGVRAPHMGARWAVAPMRDVASAVARGGPRRIALPIGGVSILSRKIRRRESRTPEGTLLTERRAAW